MWQGGGLWQGGVFARVCVCLCVCACMGEWGKGKGHGKAKREARGGEGGVQYSIYKLALSEELERCVESVHALVCVCVCFGLCKNMIQLLIDASVSVPIPMCLSFFCAFTFSVLLKLHLN